MKIGHNLIIELIKISKKKKLTKSRNQSNVNGCQFFAGMPMISQDNFRSEMPFKVDNFTLMFLQMQLL
jgi:hypothetical protein